MRTGARSHRWSLARNRRFSPIGAVAASILLASASALETPASERDEAPRPRPRYARSGERGPELPAAPAGRLPEALRLAASKDDVSSNVSASRSGGAARTRKPRHGQPVAPPPGGGLEAEAVRAAAWAAEEIARTTGRLAYYRVGAYDGMHAALDDERIGVWDRLAGVRHGGLDPEARRRGAERGALEAAEHAERSARRQVEGQFRDLSREPRFAPRVEVPGYAIRGPFAVEVTLPDVFVDLPVALPSLAAAFHDWRFDPWRLYRCRAHDDFYDAGWADPARAFDVWRGSRRRARAFHRLDRESRRRFRELFVAEFSLRLPLAIERIDLRAYDDGFDDGWHYGAFVRQEWQYRLGYNEGFDRALATSAETTFRIELPRAYDDAYAAAFDDWAHQPRPEIASVALVDGNDDGIFEPGEELFAELELINYGGARGSFVARLRGEVLGAPGELPVDLPRRDVLRPATPLRVRVDAGVRAGTRARLRLELGDSAETVRLRVSYPLEFQGPVSIENLETLDGRVTVVSRVVNRSRKPLAGTARLRGQGGLDVHDSAALGTLGAGESAAAAFELRDLRPLDLLSGGIRVRLTANARGTVHDERDYRLPRLAVDLNNRDLLRYLAALSGEPRANDADVAAARGLLLERLRVDWRAAARGRGNPYKADARRATPRTALGDLLRTSRDAVPVAVRPDVFGGLREEVLDLARDLPGVHPLLRKHFRKLARRLPS